MIESRGSDERLADAFCSLADPQGAELSEALRDQIWLAVSGALSPAERRDLVERTATDPGCAEAWRVASEMWRAAQASAVETGAVATAGLTTRWKPYWLRAAAALILVTAAGILSLRDPRPGDEFRSSSGVVVESLVPEGAALPRDSFRLRWTPGPEGSRYQVRATTEDLQVLATATDLRSPEFVIARALLTAVPRGSNVFWQVDVVLPSGGRRTSPTFITRLE